MNWKYPLTYLKTINPKMRSIEYLTHLITKKIHQIQFHHLPIYLTREQREKRLRKWAIDHNEDPDKFMTITEKDINLSIRYRDRMMSDADMIQFAKETDDDPDSLMDMTRRERLI